MLYSREGTYRLWYALYLLPPFSSWPNFGDSSGAGIWLTRCTCRARLVGHDGWKYLEGSTCNATSFEVMCPPSFDLPESSANTPTAQWSRFWSCRLYRADVLDFWTVFSIYRPNVYGYWRWSGGLLCWLHRARTEIVNAYHVRAWTRSYFWRRFWGRTVWTVYAWCW